ncbi:TerC family protein [uncultured Megasphaera sp.]|uniref:TerC family protein n=1 Tax=uncultured Megasphaera sp. TaxID=165188 RepID=UPI0025D073BF|nr:TerC family protein [uncultured Megasphaera sp.]
MLAVWLMTIPFLQVLGGLILLPIAVKLLQQEDVPDNVEASDSLFGAVRTIIIADAAMGVENVLAVAGASHGSFLLVACGFVISIPIIVGGSTIVGKLIDRYPVILYASAGLLGWTAGSMIGHDKILGTLLQQMAGSWAPISLQILLAAAVIAIGLWMSRKRVVQ